MTEAPPHPVRAAPWRVLAVILVIAAVGLLVLLAALYFARRQIAREAVTDWLRSKGVASESRFQELGPGRLAGRIRIGPAKDPDLTVERAEVDYSLAGLLAGRGVQITSVRLVRPDLKASFRGGRFSAGALDRLIAEFRRRPPSPGAPSPRIEIDQGRIALTTDYGVLHATADALVQNGKLLRLRAVSEPALVAAPGAEAGLGPASLTATTVGDRLSLSLRAPILRIRTPAGEVAGALLVVTSQGGYPDLRRPVPAAGQASFELRAAQAHLQAASAQALRVAGASHWRWGRSGGAGLTGDLDLSTEVHDLAASSLALPFAGGEFQGTYAVGAAPALRLSGRAEARGGWSGLGAPSAGDSPEIAALKRGLRAFRAVAQGVSLAADRQGVRARLTAPVQLHPNAGGEIRLSPQGGGYRLVSSGGGLPKAQAEIRRVAFTRGGATATGSLNAALSIGPLQDAHFDAAGALRIAGGEAAFTASRCVAVTAAKLDLGANDLERLSTALCPDHGPLLSLGRGGLRLAGRAEHASAAAPFLKADLGEGSGALRLADTHGRLSADLTLTSLRARDTDPAGRFRPLLISGHAALAHDDWTGAFDARLPKGATIAHAVLSQDGRSGAGQIEIATGALAFRPGGLQPTEISPLAAPIGTAVQGEASFNGALRWTKSGGTSGGALDLKGFELKSPVGAVSGLSGRIEFTSLDPIIAPPGQMLHIARIASALPLTDATASLAIDKTALTVSKAQASAGGGLVRLDGLVVPLAADRPTRGTLQLTGVQLHDLVEASPFGDRVDLDAKVSGRIPFAAQGGKVTISGGELRAIAPGRLSINRAALTSVSASGGVQAPAPAAQAAASSDTFSDFAYQALENLAFTSLEAQVDTRPGGRLGVLFHIVGYHDPPKHQEITLSWWDLIRRDFMNRKLPLPSGTGVDLTLDTTLNLDDLLKDYADFERLRSSPPVQP